MCFITITVGIVGFILYWLGLLDRPKFQVVESVLGSEAAFSSSTDDADNKQFYAIVTTAQDEEYIDSHICSVLKATKKGIEAALASSSDDDDAKKPGERRASTRSISMASSYTVTSNKVSSKSSTKKFEKEVTPDGDDNIGIMIFLQDPTTSECHETAVGFLVTASSLEDVQELVRKVAKSVQMDLQKPKAAGLPPDLDDTETSNHLGASSSSAGGSDATRQQEFFQVHAVPMGKGAVFRGHIPIRSSFTYHLARYLHWGRAHAEYTQLMATEERKVGAVACEVYVHGEKNPAMRSAYVDYLYLLDPHDREMVWKHLDTPMP